MRIFNRQGKWRLRSSIIATAVISTFLVPATLFVTHFGAHEDPSAHLDALMVHLAAMKEMSRACIEKGGSESDQMSRFVDEMRIYIQKHVPDSESHLYGRAAPIDQCWLGLARYWRKRGVQGQR